MFIVENRIKILDWFDVQHLQIMFPNLDLTSLANRMVYVHPTYLYPNLSLIIFYIILKATTIQNRWNLHLYFNK